MLVPWYLITSFLYYLREESIISDALYDQMCKQLKDQWDGVTHRHKHLIDREALNAGTGMYLKEEDYPLIVKFAAEQLINLPRRTR